MSILEVSKCKNSYITSILEKKRCADDLTTLLTFSIFFLLTLVTLTCFFSRLFFKLVNNIFLKFVIEWNKKVEKKNETRQKKVEKSKINYEFCMALIGRLGISRYLCNLISLLETENIRKHYDHNRERDKFAYLTMQLFCALCTCVFHWCTFL